jgi:hypothetical protein
MNPAQTALLDRHCDLDPDAEWRPGSVGSVRVARTRPASSRTSSRYWLRQIWDDFRLIYEAAPEKARQNGIF